jgi:ketosteroid isomerase-like protein
MSQENVEIVRSIYARWVNGDYSVADWADAEIEYRLFDGRETVGVEAMADLWRDFLATWDEFTNVPDRFLDAGESRVLVLTRFGGRSKGGGIPITDFPGASLFTLREGKVVRLFLYPSQKEALEAAGLSE